MEPVLPKVATIGDGALRDQIIAALAEKGIEATVSEPRDGILMVSTPTQTFRAYEGRRSALDIVNDFRGVLAEPPKPPSWLGTAALLSSVLAIGGNAAPWPGLRLPRVRSPKAPGPDSDARIAAAEAKRRKRAERNLRGKR